MLFNKNYNKILVVDDDEDNLNILTEFLTDMGYEVVCAKNGELALEIFQLQPCPIVITGMEMPIMTGLDLLKHVKNISPQTEVIIISSYEDLNLVVESFRNQAADFLKKPVSQKTLEISVGRAKEKIDIKKGLLDYTENLERLVTIKTQQLENFSYNANFHTELKKQLNSLPLVIFLIDQDFKVTALNNMYKQTFGDHTGQHCYCIDRNYDSPCEGCPALLTFRNHSAEKGEIKYSDREGNNKSTLVWASPVNNNSSEVMIISADISMIKGSNENLSDLGLMIGSVSHGIKGMLTGLDGGVYVLDSALKKHDEDQVKKGLNMVRKVTSRMKNMVLEILFHSKDRELKKEELHAVSYANDLMKILKPKTEQLGITLKHNRILSDFQFMADADILTPALINVIENAVDACTADDTKNQHQINFSIIQKDNHFEIEISDNGTGIDKADISKIFQLFQSGKGVRGTGLGLFITEKAVRQHRGNITVDSEKGTGTKFVITLPYE